MEARAASIETLIDCSWSWMASTGGAGKERLGYNYRLPIKTSGKYA
jgi:hypothetical protein